MISEQKQTKIQIQNSLAKMSMNEFYPAIVEFWAILGYQSDRQPDDYTFDYQSFIQSYGAGKGIKEEKAKAADWQKLYLLFQITDQEIGHSFQAEMQADIFKPKLKPELLKSYLFAALELKGDNYSRTALADIARQINRCFAIPLIIAFKYNGKITIAVVDRRRNLKDTQKDVLEKVILIKDICLSKPHRAHLDILQELSISALAAKYPLNNFDDLHKAWGKTLDLKELNKRFYKELSNWYFWAIQNVEFPDGEEKEPETRNSVAVIRLITRIFFVWFMKEKQLIPEALFDPVQIRMILNFSDFNGSTYYKGILQNLFFATLNNEMNAPNQISRRFRAELGGKYNSDFNNHNVYRYKNLFKDPDHVLKTHFLEIPFLNGGLFECLDTEHKEDSRNIYTRIDGFSDAPDNVLKVPDMLFLQEEEIEVDLNSIYGTTDKIYKVKGLLSILHSYKFTVAENTPIEEEVALDPELLGRVFENLLASYNPETRATARHDTGSFYTPREIVDFMVDETLISYLCKALLAKEPKQKDDNELRLRLLFAYTDESHLFDDDETELLIDAIDDLKAIDPACGSGAFLMGMLLKMVYVLHKLDPNNDKWKAQQISKLEEQIQGAKNITDYKVRSELIEKLEDSINDVQNTFDNYDYDYSRKLFLIEHCIFGSDIQPIAIQIAKLRFFLSLLVDEQKRKDRPNMGIRALPNLETKLVAADSLIPLKLTGQAEIFNYGLDDFRNDIKGIHNEYFTARNRKHKQSIRQKETLIRKKFAESLISLDSDEKTAELIAQWNPYASNEYASFLDMGIMFGLDNMNVVITNPPYIRQEDIKNKPELKAADYEVYNSTSDLYTYFYELSLKLLRDGGIAAFITSNKWLKTKYGLKLRKLFKHKVILHALIDFGGYKVFESATVDTNVLIYEKNITAANHQFGFLNIDSSYKGTNLQDYFCNHKLQIAQARLEDTGWTLANSLVLELKDKMEAMGKPLKEWNVSIYRGIVTGYNKAFIIDTPTKERLCKEDPKSIKILKPILRGKDIHRYHYKWARKWVIATFPAPKVNIDNYPAVKNYLSSFGTRIEQSGQKGCRKKTNNLWFETQDTIAYHNEFEKEKIVWADIADGSCFQLDQDGHYILNTAYMLIGTDLGFILGVMNSKVFDFYFKQIATGLGSDSQRGFKIFIEQYPLPTDMDPSLQQIISHNAKQLATINSDNGEAVKIYEAEINALLYEYYGFTDSDIAVLESYATS